MHTPAEGGGEGGGGKGGGGFGGEGACRNLYIFNVKVLDVAVSIHDL